MNEIDVTQNLMEYKAYARPHRTGLKERKKFYLS